MSDEEKRLGFFESYLAIWADRAVAFVAVLPMTGKRNYRRISRLVVLPDYQGVGVGSGVLESVCDLYRADGIRMGITTGHPGMIRRLWRSPKWRTLKLCPVGNAGSRRRFHKTGRRDSGSLGRCVVTFRYLGAPDSTEPSARGVPSRA